MTEDKLYIAENNLYPDWLVSIAEVATVISGSLLALIFFILWLIFHRFSSTLDTNLARSFKAEGLRSLVTVGMGLVLQLDWADGVKTLVVIRPFVLMYAVYALTLLLEHYLELFDTTILKEITSFKNRALTTIKKAYAKVKK